MWSLPTCPDPGPALDERLPVSSFQTPPPPPPTPTHSPNQPTNQPPPFSPPPPRPRPKYLQLGEQQRCLQLAGACCWTPHPTCIIPPSLPSVWWAQRGLMTCMRSHSKLEGLSQDSPQSLDSNSRLPCLSQKLTAARLILGTWRDLGPGKTVQSVSV